MKTVISSIIITLCCASVLLAKIIRVPQDQPNIQAGITAAVKGDTVLVAAGTYYENINFKGKAITVASYYLMDGDTTHINNTIIDGSQPSHADSGSVVFFISGEDTTSVLCGFTITKGSGTEISYAWKGTQYFERAGGGILCLRAGARIVSNKIIENSVFSANKAAYGGGLAAEALESSPMVILQNNRISNNTVTANTDVAKAGGISLSRCKGILLHNRIDYNSVIHNATTKRAFAGGLICYSEESDRREIILEFNKINHNKVTSYSDQFSAFGGGIVIQGNEGRFVQNEVSHNEIWVKTGNNAVGAGIEVIVANFFLIESNTVHENVITNGRGYGGGFGFGFCSSRMTNNVISGNSATCGGAIFVTKDVYLQLINNTIVDNHASENGGGLYVRINSVPVLMNNIIWNNQSPTPGIYSETGTTVHATYCDIQGGWDGTGNINVDPLVNDKYHLADASPCIDKGNPDPAYNDPEDPSNPGFALFPAKGTVRNDMGAFGGPGARKTITANEVQPNTFVLFQNYPNPFNSITTIKFALPNPAFTLLKIYNLLGEEVATLVAEKRLAGVHKFNWDASGLASGVYLYRLEAGKFVQAKKLILMR